MPHLRLTTEQQATVRVRPRSASGAPARIESIAWESSAPERVAVLAAPFDPDAFEHTAVIRAIARGGNVSVIVTADADLGDGRSAIQESIEIDVQEPQAQALEVVIDDPELQ